VGESFGLGVPSPETPISLEKGRQDVAYQKTPRWITPCVLPLLQKMLGRTIKRRNGWKECLKIILERGTFGDCVVCPDYEKCKPYIEGRKVLE